MKRILCFACAAAILLGLLTGCKDKAAETGEPADIQSATLLTEEECRALVADCYPEGVTVNFEKLDEVDGKTAIVFYINRDSDSLMVGRAAVTATDGALWLWDMAGGERWISSAAFVYGDALPETPAPRAYFEFSHTSDLTGEADVLYFAHLRDFSELLPGAEGHAYWREADNSLEMTITVVTGSLDGQPAGPGLSYFVQWQDDEPVVALSDAVPAPMFTSPAEVMGSGLEAAMEDDRVIALAEFLRDKIAELKE